MWHPVRRLPSVRVCVRQQQQQKIIMHDFQGATAYKRCKCDRITSPLVIFIHDFSWWLIYLYYLFQKDKRVVLLIQNRQNG